MCRAEKLWTCPRFLGHDRGSRSDIGPNGVVITSRPPGFTHPSIRSINSCGCSTCSRNSPQNSRSNPSPSYDPKSARFGVSRRVYVPFGTPSFSSAAGSARAAISITPAE